MAVYVDVIANVVGHVVGFVRGWTFRVPFAGPPTPAELTTGINDLVDLMQRGGSPRLQKWLDDHRPELAITIMGIYRDE